MEFRVEEPIGKRRGRCTRWGLKSTNQWGGEWEEIKRPMELQGIEDSPRGRSRQGRLTENIPEQGVGIREN